jgi:hypothetical protein
MAPATSSGAPATPPASTGNLRTRRGLTLRARLVLALLSVAALPLLATAGGGMLLARSSLISQGQQALLGRAQGTATKIDSYLQATRTNLISTRQSVAALQPLLGATDPNVRQNALHSLEHILSSVRSASVGTFAGQLADFVDTNGIVLAADPTGDEGANLHKQPAVVAALAGTITTTGAAFDPAAPSDLRETFSVAVPVLPPGGGGRPSGALVERFSLQKIVGFVQQDADTQGSGGLLVEPQTGLVVAESLPPNTYTFTSLAPLSSSAMQTLIASQRYVPTQPGQQPAVQTIPGLSLSKLGASGAHIFSAGTFGGSDAGALLYVRVPLAQAPEATPWVYLLATPQSVLTAPADQLGLFAAIVLGIALVLSLVIGIYTARRISAWIGGAVRQLGVTASAFLRQSDEQRQTTEEQRHRLGGARSALHDLHRLGSEVTEALEQGIAFIEDGQRGRGRPTYGARGDGAAPNQFGNQFNAAALSPQEKQAWWGSWAQGMQDRLHRVHDICTGLARDSRVTADAANNLRARGAEVYTQATALDASLWAGGAALAIATPEAPARTTTRAAARAAERTAERQVGSGFNTSALRLTLLGLLVALGLLPSLAFALSSGRTLRTDLTSQSTSALFVQAQSNASAVDALLNQQQQQLYALGNFYASAVAGNSTITSDALNQVLTSAIGPEASGSGTTLLALASVPDGQVFAASTASAIGTSLAQLPVFHAAANGTGGTTPAYYDPQAQAGWYYTAVPIRSADQKTVIGVVVGRFPMLPIWHLLSETSMTSGTQQGAYSLLVEQADGVVFADSRAPQGVFNATTSLNSQALSGLWTQGRYPQTQQPPVTALPEVAAHLQGQPVGTTTASFAGSGGANGARNQFWLIPLSKAPWSLAQALPLAVATGIADQLTRLDLLLLVVVVVATAGLALVLGQSIIVPVRRLRARFRQASRLLVTITRRQDEAAQRQEAALPPIETTAELLSLETEEVAALLFPQQAVRAPLTPPAAAPRLPGANGWNNGTNGASGGNGFNGAYGGTEANGLNGNSGANWGDAPRGMGAMDENPPIIDAMPARQVARVPARGPGEAGDRATEALRQARNMAGDWNLRQQRIMADLAAALNATDELSRASAEGQREAVDLGNMVGELLASAR